MLFKRTVAAQLHALGAVLAIVSAHWLLPTAWEAGWSHFGAATGFVITGFLVFFASALVHFLNDGFELSPQWHNRFLTLDYSGIYLFIAGTYTPFILSIVDPGWRVTLLTLVWSIAVLGICYINLKSRLPEVLQTRGFSTSLFLMMGWIIVIRFMDLVNGLTVWQFVLVASGGALYTLGAFVYVTDRPKLLAPTFGSHELWHLMVLAGAVTHFFAVWSLYPA